MSKQISKENFEEKVDKTAIREVFKKGILYRVDAAGWWGKSTKCKEDEVLQPQDGEEGVMGGIKELVDPKELATIRSARSKGERVLTKFGFPFLGLRGVYFVPKDFIPASEELLKDADVKFKTSLDVLISEMPRIKKDAKKRLGSFYDEKLYPKPEDLRSYFRFGWTKFILDVPNSDLGVLTDEQYQEELKKQIDQMSEFMNSALAAVATQFKEILDKMIEKLETGKPVNKRFLESMSEFGRTFSAMNITGHKPLEELVERTFKAIGETTTAEDFKNDKFAGKVKKSMAVIAKKFSELAEKDSDLARALEF